MAVQIITNSQHMYQQIRNSRTKQQLYVMFKSIMIYFQFQLLLLLVVVVVVAAAAAVVLLKA